MKVYLSQVNDFPYVAFHHWEFQPLEIIQLYKENGGNDQKLIDDVIKLDPIYVKFRELDALNNRIGSALENMAQIKYQKMDNPVPENLPIITDMLQSVGAAKKELIEKINDEDLTAGRNSLMQIVRFLKGKEIIELGK